MCDIQHLIEPFDTEYIHRDDWCTGELVLLPHQVFTGNMVMECTKNMLVYHGLGSGKTCTSIVIIETLKHHSSEQLDVLVVCPASIRHQYIDEFKKCPTSVRSSYDVAVPDMMTRYDRIAKTRMLTDMELRKYDALKKKYYSSKENVLKNNNIQVLSYDKMMQTKFINELLSNGRKKLIVIDEVQNFVSETSDRFKNFELLMFQLHQRNLLHRLFLMTATPIINYPNDIGMIMKLLDPTNTNIHYAREQFMEAYSRNRDALSDILRSHVTYISGGNPNAFPFKRIIVREHLMSDSQHELYIQELVKIYQKRKEQRDFIQFVDTMEADTVHDRMPAEMSNMRRLCNSSRLVEGFVNSEFESFAPKLYSIVMDILSSVDKTTFVFSSQIVGSIDIMERALKEYGYRQWTPNAPEDGKNYFVWIGDTDKTLAESARDVFNSKDNIHGRRIKVIFGSKTVSEGITFKNVSILHVVDSWWNNALIKQVIARCVRFGSHCDMYDSESSSIPTVTVYRHVCIFDPIRRVLPLLGKHNILSWLSLDEYMYFLSSLKQVANNRFEVMLKENAVDCQAFQKGNLTRLEERWIPVKTCTPQTRMYRYFQDPLSRKFIISNEPYEFDINEIHGLDAFRKYPHGTTFVQVTIDDKRRELIPFETPFSLIVGENMTNTLVLYEDINCLH